MNGILAAIQYSLPQSSTLAPHVDLLFNALSFVCLLSFVAVIGAILYFILRYNRRRTDPDNTHNVEGHTGLEIGISVVLLIWVMGVFYWGWVDYVKMRQVPPNPIEINVTASQWKWEFEYTNGNTLKPRTEKINGKDISVPEIVVPKGKPVKLIMTSKDVLHSFFIPDFRLKQDLVPGSYSYLWFNATEVSKPGDHVVFCAEYCGTDHSMMMAKIRVVEPEEYEKWQKQFEYEKLGITAAMAEEKSSTPTPSSQPPKETANLSGGQAEAQSSPPLQAAPSPADRGKKLFSDKGCTACHTVTGQALVGPTLKGIFGHEVELVDGTKIIADENYLRESITNSQAKIVKGFTPSMPVYQGQLSDQEIGDLIAYIKSLGN